MYVLDGNWAVGMTAPLIVSQADPMHKIEPYLQVSVGYAGEEAQHWARLRNRDLVPPGEPVAKKFLDAVETGVQAGRMTRATRSSKASARAVLVLPAKTARSSLSSRR
ncbi:hypothetical protein [Amycolatopsis jiangsuensis]|uniref:Uncharacterized protein n=1 Tax=Amycolatopsis jiangsuensis TaxID=1181879 RepID=A0A840IWN0_9PSEU|nr:hypothetical protein [Amycolatopsis jiangsuensis]MBB4685727.1 hypothetical protein [Amycolatopsis jiangsuensis]